MLLDEHEYWQNQLCWACFWWEQGVFLSYFGKERYKISRCIMLVWKGRDQVVVSNDLFPAGNPTLVWHHNGDGRSDLAPPKFTLESKCRSKKPQRSRDFSSQGQCQCLWSEAFIVSPRGHVCKIWRKSLKVFSRYRALTDGHPENILPPDLASKHSKTSLVEVTERLGIKPTATSSAWQQQNSVRRIHFSHS